MDLAPSFLSRQARVRPQSRARRSVAIWAIALVAVATLAAFGWSWATRPLELSGVRVSQGPVAEAVYATGFVEPRQPVRISSRVTAPVQSVLVDEGDRVVRGQALVLLDSEDQREVISQLAAQTLNAEQDERRALALFRQGFLANAARDKAVATATSARAVEAAARARLDQYTIRSGIPGVILRRDVEPGDLATSTKTLFEMGDPRALRVTATVDERDIPLVRIGAEVAMSSEAFPNRIIHGRVSELTPGGDPDQRAFRVYIQPEGAAGLPIGLTLEVNIMVSDKRDALLVPAGAVRNGAVWVVEGGKLHRRMVETGIHGGERTEIVRGLRAGECVAKEASEKLKDGKRVSSQGC